MFVVFSGYSTAYVWTGAMIQEPEKSIREMVAMTSLSKLIVATGVTALISWVTIPTVAQTQPAERQELQNLIEELKTQLDRGERERLIDPWFLRDLRQTVGRYEYPWGKRLLSDDFSGRGPQPDPPWQVTAGEFLIDWRYGLRSVVEPQSQTREESQATEEEAVMELFGKILKEAVKEEEAPEEPTETSAGETGFAAAIAPVAITNAFALRLEMTSRSKKSMAGSRFEFGPYQDEKTLAGYRLVYMPGVTPSLELASISPRGAVATVEIHDEPVALEDERTHSIEWTRDSDGRMVIMVDGTEVIHVVDRRFRDSFNGIAVINAGGDYALRSITIDGTE